jgi:hypothetical protein
MKTHHTYTPAFLLLIAVMASISLSPSQVTADERQSHDEWSFRGGDPGAWKVFPNRLMCSVKEPGNHWVISKAPLAGDFVIEASLGPATGKGEGLFFSANADLSYGYVLALGPTANLYKISGSNFDLVTSWPVVPPLAGTNIHVSSSLVRILKKGTTYRFELGGQITTLSNPGGETAAKQRREPEGGYWGFSFNTAGVHNVFRYRAVEIPRVEYFSNNPVLTIGPAGAWDQSVEVFPAAVLRDGREFYLYYVADYKPYPPGVGLEPPRRLGVATSRDLRSWKKYEKNPIFGPPLEGDTVGFFGFPASTKYATMHGGGGAVRLANGHYGLTFNVQQDHQWTGVWYAESSSPLGPFAFQNVNPGPVVGLGSRDDFDGRTIHLNGTLQLADGTYAMLYTGHNPGFETDVPSGDRGGLATSKDMIHWTKFAGNPVYEPGEAGSWDDRHVRPKTLAKLGAWYYMFYEGAHRNQGGWPPWVDQIGMARSRDLIRWKRYPNNPVVSTTTLYQSGNIATIQPTVLVDNEALYVFYGCIHSESASPVAVCGARIPSEILQGW